MCFYNGGSRGLRSCFASILSRGVRYPRPPPVTMYRELQSRHLYTEYPERRDSSSPCSEAVRMCFFMRGSYSGNTLAFQAKARSSILLPRSKFNLCLAQSGRVLGLEPRGRRFESYSADQLRNGPIMVLERIANPSTLERGFLSSSLSRSANTMPQ